MCSGNAWNEVYAAVTGSNEPITATSRTIRAPDSQIGRRHIGEESLFDVCGANVGQIYKKTPLEASLEGFCCDSVGIRTQDPQLRRLLLYPTELRSRIF